ncbi:uncharacterized protein LAESUDRAFT_102723 [Laetiporus sulphureus 93-53]|uniref:Uncharacterized protein n=1 Tax=Laetiporus sulphureus 93-53 TaxID=1314785 RepID=A0A165ET46_9APHY|nr:uncharacterized protein LAESUDRAFT_102723 [Laetiporus sulphureus 93-53]KZT07702.1 hypothetical protein LAESUDRAFT_102723 [Laetiporus sulphureus 93-53]
MYLIRSDHLRASRSSRKRPFLPSLIGKFTGKVQQTAVRCRLRVRRVVALARLVHVHRTMTLQYKVLPYAHVTRLMRCVSHLGEARSPNVATSRLHSLRIACFSWPCFMTSCVHVEKSVRLNDHPLRASRIHVLNEKAHKRRHNCLQQHRSSYQHLAF